MDGKNNMSKEICYNHHSSNNSSYEDHITYESNRVNPERRRKITNFIIGYTPYDLESEKVKFIYNFFKDIIVKDFQSEFYSYVCNFILKEYKIHKNKVPFEEYIEKIMFLLWQFIENFIRKNEITRLKPLEIRKTHVDEYLFAVKSVLFTVQKKVFGRISQFKLLDDFCYGFTHDEIFAEDIFQLTFDILIQEIYQIIDIDELVGIMLNSGVLGLMNSNNPIIKEVNFNIKIQNYHYHNIRIDQLLNPIYINNLIESIINDIDEFEDIEIIFTNSYIYLVNSEFIHNTVSKLECLTKNNQLIFLFEDFKDSFIKKIKKCEFIIEKYNWPDIIRKKQINIIFKSIKNNENDMNVFFQATFGDLWITNKQRKALFDIYMEIYDFIFERMDKILQLLNENLQVK